MRLSHRGLCAAGIACHALYAPAQAQEDVPALYRQQEAQRQVLATGEAPKGSARASRLDQQIEETAQRHNVPLQTARAIIKIESNYSCTARSRAGARGIMQVLPATARFVGVRGNLYDCATGLEAGMRYLALILQSYGTSCASLSLYERGLYARQSCTAYGRRAIHHLR